jgi:hypothetical protein
MLDVMKNQRKVKFFKYLRLPGPVWQKALQGRPRAIQQFQIRS